MRLLVLSRYCRQGASSRLRTMQYRPYLEAAGFQVEFASLFDLNYLKGFYEGRRGVGPVLTAYARRLAQLQLARSVDVIWLEKEALPWVPWAIERHLLPRGVPIVVDYDDAVFHRYDGHRRRLVRGMLGTKIDNVMGHAAAVTAGNAYLADRATKAGARRIEIVPTVVDTNVYETKRPADGAPVIGWIGTPETYRLFVKPMMPTLYDLARSQRAQIHLVGADPRAAGGCVSVSPWSEETEVSLIQTMDLGIMPLPDTPWARGKCGYKIIQYMACGLPVVASPVGVNRDIVDSGETGILAKDGNEWRQALERLMHSPGLRQRMGRAGRRKVEHDFSLQRWGPKVARIITQVSAH